MNELVNECDIENKYKVLRCEELYIFKGRGQVTGGKKFKKNIHWKERKKEICMICKKVIWQVRKQK